MNKKKKEEERIVKKNSMEFTLMQKPFYEPHMVRLWVANWVRVGKIVVVIAMTSYF